MCDKQKTPAAADFFRRLPPYQPGTGSSLSTLNSMHDSSILKSNEFPAAATYGDASCAKTFPRGGMSKIAFSYISADRKRKEKNTAEKTASAVYCSTKHRKNTILLDGQRLAGI